MVFMYFNLDMFEELLECHYSPAHRLIYGASKTFKVKKKQQYPRSLNLSLLNNFI